MILSVTVTTFQGHSQIRQLQKFKAAYFGQFVSIPIKTLRGQGLNHVRNASIT